MLCKNLSLKGTILLSTEGIYLSLAGSLENIQNFKSTLKQNFHLSPSFRESTSDTIPFKRLKVKLKKEIITLKEDHIHPEQEKAPYISPEIFKQWLDEKRDVIVLDTRNDYEIDFGTFENAVNLHLKHFNEFPLKSHHLEKNIPIVTFCTGGIRCEKAALYLLKKGYPCVYQLEGGILNYFKQVGGTHYQGKCFVFDDRIAIDANFSNYL